MRQRQRSARKKRRHPSKVGMRAKVAKRPELVTLELGGRKLVRVWKLCCQWWGMRSGGELGGFGNWAGDLQQLSSTVQWTWSQKFWKFKPQPTICPPHPWGQLSPFLPGASSSE